MGKLIGLVKPLTGYMVLAITMGLIGHLCASLITIFGGYAVLNVLGFETTLGLQVLFVSMAVFCGCCGRCCAMGEQALQSLHRV